MKTPTWSALALIALTTSVHAQTAMSQPYVFERGYPTAETTQRSRDDVDFERAVTAYRFWYPTVSAEGIFEGSRAAGLKDDEAFLIASTGPKAVAFTANSDTPYGAGALDLSNGPMVIELPPGPYIGLVDDHHQRWIMDMGLPGPDGAKGGKHVILPPGHKGEPPRGYHVGRSSTFKVLFAVRALPVGGNLAGALDALRAVKIYALSTAARPRLITPIDLTDKPLDSTCLRWEENLQFWEVLHRIVDTEPIVEEFLPMYGLLASVGVEKGKTFAPDARLKGILERAAKAGRDQLLVASFDSARSDRMAWPDRKWEWVGLVPGTIQFETPSGLDMEARDRWFAQAIVTSLAMFRRTAGAGSLYWLGVRDKSGGLPRRWEELLARDAAPGPRQAVLVRHRLRHGDALADPDRPGEGGATIAVRDEGCDGIRSGSLLRPHRAPWPGGTLDPDHSRPGLVRLHPDLRPRAGGVRRKLEARRLRERDEGAQVSGAPREAMEDAHISRCSKPFRISDTGITVAAKGSAGITPGSAMATKSLSSIGSARMPFTSP